MSRLHLISSAVLCTSLVAFALGGCSKKEPPPSQEVKEAPAAPTPAVKPAAAEDPQVLQEFQKRVDEYVKLRKRVDDSVPPLKPKRTAEQIAEHEQALARKLREARSGAKQGDIFTPDISAQFALLIRREFRGPEAPAAVKTIRQGEPVPSISLRVNETYPDSLPVTTMPPTLLSKLPELPKEVAYRIVGRDFVLVDMSTNVVVDFIPEVMPPVTG